ncbi:hypothetical protein EV361DRAFT_949073 [Lentinula raphanica]|uniref:HMG box domain-containing protein n=1 Tax=Lentinula raphanica TaxID=153919 RepID=A0AA38PCI3_9AGAR|nr:hypothetical protein C8R42DRAFT_727558 [Lentinula raphanica]KAJ3757642.1 hypothetical protein EV360DRAFT_83823 [Lentinula raphanica]KAJ3773229.1 hypothetical protein FB446DRAFT_787987 [Lentinula raphanica]KAJ3824516.1 hypothetical protein F5880DRAFT_1611944 [Lentinula raphanica]KAJ3840236.1 hypothetical protein F5878DRAFT_659594 [Lentinula raphanica]
MSSQSQYPLVDASAAARTSHSPSDDGSNYYQGDGPKDEGTSYNVETNQSLTSQTLNADGTPKRPMNAFMIFARRRRPQVSSENQSMRTGEISKILSKEWNTMPASEKQFYLDRAKELKENFNSKYPDYVYRRRPNHSRKRRKTDAGVHSIDGSGTPDNMQDEGLPRVPYDDHHGGGLHSRPSLPSYGSSDPYGRESSRHPYLNADRPNHHHHSMSPPLNHNAPLPSPRLPGQSNSIPALHSYLSSQNLPSAGQSHHMYGSSSNHHSSHGSSWEHSRLDNSGKIGNDNRLDSSHGRSSSAGSNSIWPVPERSSSRGYAGQSGSPTSSGPSSSTGGGGQDSNFNFPTLNSPFFPTPSQMFNSNSGSSASSTGNGHSTSTGGSGGSAFGAGSNQLPPPGSLTTSNSRNGYDHRPYAPSPPPLGGASFAQSASRHGLGSSNGLGSGGLGGIGSLGSLNGLGSGGNSNLARSLPPVQSIPGYSQSGLSGTGGPGGEMGDMWSRGSVNGP